jgi:hypothetical protein
MQISPTFSIIWPKRLVRPLHLHMGASFDCRLNAFLNFPAWSTPTRPWASSRIVIVLPYILIYDYIDEDDTLTLLRVVHGKRNITRRLIRGA